MERCAAASGGSSEQWPAAATESSTAGRDGTGPGGPERGTPRPAWWTGPVPRPSARQPRGRLGRGLRRLCRAGPAGGGARRGLALGAGDLPPAAVRPRPAPRLRDGRLPGRQPGQRAAGGPVGSRTGAGLRGGGGRAGPGRHGARSRVGRVRLGQRHRGLVGGPARRGVEHGRRAPPRRAWPRRAPRRLRAGRHLRPAHHGRGGGQFRRLAGRLRGAAGRLPRGRGRAPRRAYAPGREERRARGPAGGRTASRRRPPARHRPVLRLRRRRGHRRPMGLQPLHRGPRHGDGGERCLGGGVLGGLHRRPRADGSGWSPPGGGGADRCQPRPRDRRPRRCCGGRPPTRSAAPVWSCSASVSPRCSRASSRSHRSASGPTGPPR